MKQTCVFLLLLILASSGDATPRSKQQANQTDVVIYGGTSAAVISAVQVKRMGQSVVIVSPDKHLGGLSSGGLGWTDTGDKSVIGGLSREFYQRIYDHYDRPGAWKWQEKSAYGTKGQGTRAMDGRDRTMWVFEPHVAEQVFEDLIAEHDIPVVREEWLDRTGGVQMDAQRIRSISTLSGKTFAGTMFIDATYEGDLMAAAGVSYAVGREANSVYNETWNGVQVGVLHHRHHFDTLQVSPYTEPGNRNSPVLPRISTADPGRKGDGDHRVQAYCFRMCLTDHADNRVPFAKPTGYDPEQYELLLRTFEAGLDPMSLFGKFDRIPNNKTDTNNHGPFSFDNIGMNWDYPDATYPRRQQILKEHETYQQGLLYFICTDPRVPEKLQSEMNRWGLAKDEFIDNGHWPHQLYIREARRMIGHYVTTENDVLGKRTSPHSVGMGSYTMDSHNVQRYITPDGFVQNEGDIGVRPKKPYHIAYGSIIPRKEECENLLVPVCVSSSHIAFGSIRMEPVFMILGQSAATAACIALEDGVSVQDVAYDKLRRRLRDDEQRLSASGPTQVRIQPVDDVGFAPLFNGRDLAGWSVQCKPADADKQYWTVDNGTILVDSLDDGDHNYVWLMTNGEYGDFTLRLKFQIYPDSPGNSGVQIRSRYDREAGWLDGPQLDIHPPNPMRAGLIYDETRGTKRWISPSLERGNHKIPKSETNPNVKLLYGEGTWNEMEIIAKGARIQCRVNGELATDYDGSGVLDDADHQKHNVGTSGHIALQLHNRDKLKARFKDIEIRER